MHAGGPSNRRFRRKPLAAADPPAAGEARLFPGEDLAAAAGLGAVAVKNAVYALPGDEQTQEDFEWLLREITEGGGEAVLCEAG